MRASTSCSVIFEMQFEAAAYPDAGVRTLHVNESKDIMNTFPPPNFGRRGNLTILLQIKYHFH